MFLVKKALPRRTFLRGIGVTVGLPLLDAMVPALSALRTTPAKPTPRLGFCYVPNGIQLANFLPKVAGEGFEGTPVLAPIMPFRDALVVVSGLANSAGDTLDLGSGPHSRCAAVWLNGVRPKRTEGADIQAGTTIDQFAAGVLGNDTPLRSLEIALEPNFAVGNCEGGYSCAYINTVSWRTPTSPLPMETNPRVVFERLFGEDASTAARVSQMQKDHSILDLVTQEMNQLQRTLGPGDRRTVDEYLDAIRDVEHRMQQTERHLETSPEPTIERPIDIPGSFAEHARIMFDLQFLAYQADITRVVTFQMARELSTRSYPEIGVSEEHHDVSHHGNHPHKVAQNTKINVYHMELFARFLEKMRSTPDGDGSLLDHSILLYGSGMGDGDRHLPHDLPIVLVGRGGGQLRGGHHLKAPVDTPMMNLGLSLLDKVGVELERVGDSTGRLSGL